MKHSHFSLNILNGKQNSSDRLNPLLHSEVSKQTFPGSMHFYGFALLGQAKGTEKGALSHALGEIKAKRTERRVPGILLHQHFSATTICIQAMDS
jgi:hypothetical protein